MVETYLRADGLGTNLKLHFHKRQMEAYLSDKRVVAVLAGTQGGKTSFGAWWLNREIAEKGGGDYLAVSANFDLFNMKMLPELLRCFTDTLHVGRYWAGDRVIEIKEPGGGYWARDAKDEMYARIILRSAAAGRGEVGRRGLESATAKAAWLDEAGLDDFTLPAWEAVQRRLSLAEGRVLITTTLYNFGWLKTEVYDRWERGDEDIDVIQFPSIANPAFPRAEYYRMKRKLPEWKFDMIYNGVYTKPAGMIYNNFSERTCVVPGFAVPTSWKRRVGIDPGPDNTGIVYVAKDPMINRWLVYAESLSGGVGTRSHVFTLRSKLAGCPDVTYYGGAPSEKQFRTDWNDFGVRVNRPSIADVEGGINKVYELIASGTLLITGDCPMLIGEFTSYSRELDERGEPTVKIKNKERYHLLDALRYAVSGIDVTGGRGRYAVAGRRTW